jgi:hypothetical protein
MKMTGAAGEEPAATGSVESANGSEDQQPAE